MLYSGYNLSQTVIEYVWLVMASKFAIQNPPHLNAVKCSLTIWTNKLLIQGKAVILSLSLLTPSPNITVNDLTSWVPGGMKGEKKNPLLSHSTCLSVLFWPYLHFTFPFLWYLRCIRLKTKGSLSSYGPISVFYKSRIFMNSESPAIRYL